MEGMHSYISIYYTHAFNSVRLHEIKVKNCLGKKGLMGVEEKKAVQQKNGENVCKLHEFLTFK